MWPKRLPYFLRFFISAMDNNVNVKKSLTLCQNEKINNNSMNYRSI